MKKTIIVGIILISLLFLGGCAYVGQICSQFLPEVFCGVITCVFGEAGLQNILNNQEVSNFLQTHPDAEITLTLMPKSNVLRNIDTLSMELGTEPQIKDYIELGLRDGSNTLTVWVDANTKELNYVKLRSLEQPSPKQTTPSKEEEKDTIDMTCKSYTKNDKTVMNCSLYTKIDQKEEKAPTSPKEEKEDSVVVKSVPFEQRRDKCWYGDWDKPIGYENRNKVWVDCQ